jgi:DNA repair protein RecO (recombination protein O)
VPGLYRDEGVVLQTIKLGEADRIVTFFTRHNGKLRAVAKGIRKTKSRFGARLEPFTQVRLMLYRGRGDLDTITQADILTPFKELWADYDSYIRASALAEIVEKITPDREQATSTYELLLGALRSLVSGGGEAVVPAFLVKLLSLSGYHPQLSACAGCGDERAFGVFSAALGGAACHSCWEEDRDAIPLDADRFDLLAGLLSAEFGARADPDAVADVTRALRHYAEYHIERPLRSVEMLSVSR